MSADERHKLESVVDGAESRRALFRQCAAAGVAIVTWFGLIRPAAVFFGTADLDAIFLYSATGACLFAWIDGRTQPGRGRQLDHNIVWAVFGVYCATLVSVIRPQLESAGDVSLRASVVLGSALFFASGVPALVQGLFGTRTLPSVRRTREAAANSLFQSIAFLLGGMWSLAWNPVDGPQMPLTLRLLAAVMAIGGLLSSSVLIRFGMQIRKWFLASRFASRSLMQLGWEGIAYASTYAIAIGLFAAGYWIIGLLLPAQFEPDMTASATQCVSLSWRTQTTFGGSTLCPSGAIAKGVVSLQALLTFVWTTAGIAALGARQFGRRTSNVLDAVRALFMRVREMRAGLGFYVCGYLCVAIVFGVWMAAAWRESLGQSTESDATLMEFLYVSLMTITTVGQDVINTGNPAISGLAAAEVITGFLWTGLVVSMLTVRGDAKSARADGSFYGA